MADALRYPSLDALRAFDAAARLATFERAADELAITASAVSKRVGTLEELLGAALFLRGGKQLVLTAAGREYLGQVRQVLALLAAMPQHRRDAQRCVRLVVSSPPTFARQVLVPLLPGFTRRHPEVELELLLSVPYLDSPAAGADVVVRHGDVAALGARALMDDLVTPLAAPALLDALPRLASPVALGAAPLLRTPIEPWVPWFRAAGLEWGEPAHGPKFVDLGLTLEAAATAQGIALARPSLARGWIARGELVPLFPITARPAGGYALMPIEPGAAGGAAEAFARWLVPACRDWAREAHELLSARG